MRKWFWTGLTLRSRLLLLGVATLLPLGLFTVAAFAVMLFQQKAQIEQSTLGMTRALATSIDARMQRTIEALDAFSIAQSLGEADADGLLEAHKAARLLSAARPDWRGLALTRPDGSVLFESATLLGATGWTGDSKRSVAEVTLLNKPVVGPMSTDARGNTSYTISVPVQRRGEVYYVLTAFVRTDAILEVIQRQQLPGHWVVSVFDSNSKRVARTKDHGRYVGTSPSPTLQKMFNELGDKKEAIGITRTMEEEKAYTAVSRIDASGWKIAVGASSEIAHAALWRTASLYSAGLLLSLLVGAAAFWFVGRSITNRVWELRESAVALGLGKPLPTDPGGLPDFDEVSAAIWEAGQLRTKAEQEREESLRSEQAARQSAECAQARLQLLLAATGSLAQSLDENTTLRALAAVIVPSMADALRIDLLNDSGALDCKLCSPPAVAEHKDETESRAPSPHSSSIARALDWSLTSGQERVVHLDAKGVFEVESLHFRNFAEVTGMVAACIVPLMVRDRVVGVMAAIRTSSERAFTQEDVALFGEIGRSASLALDNVRLYGECANALNSAKAASQAKDEFLAMLGHELRNPLAPILTSLEIMKRRDASTFIREREIIERQAKHLALLVDDLLDVSRIVAGKIKLQLEAVDLRSVVQRAIEVTQPLYENRAAPIVVGDEQPARVRGDFLRLAQVVGNLLNNAAKFSEPEELVTIAFEFDSGQVRLSVRDRGPGIPESLRAQVFDRFIQSPQGLHRSGGGLGLGLNIARSITELHGGDIKADQGEDGRGTIITVSLPLVAAEVQEETPTTNHEAGSTLKVMVVDDNEDAAQLLASLLLLSDYRVEVAYSGEECLSAIDEFAPDACIVDIGLPGMDGYQLARELRARPAFSSTCLIALSGYCQPSDRERSISAGFNEHMAKPATAEMIEAALRRTAA